VLAEKIADSKELAVHKNLSKYDDRCRSNYAYRIKQRLDKIKKYLTNKEKGFMRAITKEQI